MNHISTLTLALLLLVTTLATQGPASSAAQQPDAGVLPQVRLEAHEGKTTFYLGEPIQLDLVFENRTGAAFQLNNMLYGDLSEKVEVAPADGWIQWQTPSGHDFLSETALTAAPIRVPIQLDEGFVFRDAGQYRIRVTTARLIRGAGLAPANGPAVPPVTTNEVILTLETMPAAEETTRLEAIRADLVNAPNTRAGAQLKGSAMHRLATLQGDAALDEKIRLLITGDDAFRSVYREAFATTRNLPRQLTLLEQAWNDPAATPTYDTPDALAETRLLLAGRNLRGWHMLAETHTPDAVEQRLAAAHHADMAALLDSMPRRVGESRIMGAYFLVEFAGLTPAEQERAADYAVEEFPHMDDLEQHMLLETARPPLRDARLIPTLRAMLTANPQDKDATAALLAMAPAESATWIAASVCAPGGAVLLATYKDSHVDRVPAVDMCLAPLLRTAPASPRDTFNWKQRATEAARFASPAILPAVREGWKTPEQDGAALAVLMRDDPAGAVQLLEAKTAGGKLDASLFFETHAVYEQVQQPFADQVLTWLRTRLAGGTDHDVLSAAWALSIGGEPSDIARLEQRLERLHRDADGHDLSGDAQRAEVELASALGSYASRTFIDAPQRKQLGQACMTAQCRQYLH